jgi:hypothetical protein
MSGIERLRRAIKADRGAAAVLAVEPPPSRPVLACLKRLRVEHTYLRSCLDMEPVPLGRVEAVERTLATLAAVLRRRLAEVRIKA